MADRLTGERKLCLTWHQGEATRKYNTSWCLQHCPIGGGGLPGGGARLHLHGHWRGGGGRGGLCGARQVGDGERWFDKILQGHRQVQQLSGQSSSASTNVHQKLLWLNSGQVMTGTPDLVWKRTSRVCKSGLGQRLTSCLVVGNSLGSFKMSQSDIMYMCQW